MAIATVTDVLRVLRSPAVTPEQEDQIAKALETATQWAKRFLSFYQLGEDGPLTVVYLNVKRGAYLRVLGEPLSVKTFDYHDSAGATLDATRWQWDGFGIQIRSFADEVWYDPRYSDVPMYDRGYVKVEVEVDVEDADPVLRDGVAYAAAALWTRGPRVGRGYRGENIGDYSYTLSDLKQGDPFYEDAKSLLRPLKQSGVAVA